MDAGRDAGERERGWGESLREGGRERLEREFEGGSERETGEKETEGWRERDGGRERKTGERK